MKSTRFRAIIFCIVSFFLVASQSLIAQTAEEYQNRRKAVLSKMEPNSVAIFRSRGSLGKFHGERQDGNFYYLTGINEPQACLVLSKSLRNRAPEILFVMPQNPRLLNWDAQPLGVEGAKQKFGFKDVRASADIQSYFADLLLGVYKIMYLDIERSSGLMEPLTSDEQILKRAYEKGASFKLLPARDLLTEFGRARSPAEIALIRKATDITAEAQLAAMRSVQPGLYEYQVQAIIEYVYTLNGAQRSAFASIIGSGKNSCILHWMENSRKMQSGDLVVIDIGAEYKLYGSDITRTIPVNGKFSPRQKEVYEIVLAANTAAIEMVEPGVSFGNISKKAADIVGEGLVKLGLIKNKKEYRKYYFHGLGHSIGLRIGGRGGLGILEPGMVLTIEPGIYITEEGLGVRIEDDVLVTETGHEVLSLRVPKTVEAIERVMKEKGLDHTKFLLDMDY